MKVPVSTPIPKAKPKVDLDVTRERLAQLGLVRAAERRSLCAVGKSRCTG